MDIEWLLLPALFVLSNVTWMALPALAAIYYWFRLTGSAWLMLFAATCLMRMRVCDPSTWTRDQAVRLTLVFTAMHVVAGILPGKDEEWILRVVNVTCAYGYELLWIFVCIERELKRARNKRRNQRRTRRRKELRETHF